MGAFALFIWTVQHNLRQIIRVRRDAAGIAATVSLSWVVTMTVLMLLDPHLTMRGAADLFFPLLALSFAGAASQEASVTKERTEMFLQQR